MVKDVGFVAGKSEVSQGLDNYRKVSLEVAVFALEVE